jgi:hypothetical protein
MRKLLPAVFLLAACGYAPEKTGYLLLDAQALQAGVTLEVGRWRGAPVTPVSFDVGDTVHVLGPAGPVLPDVQPGELGYVQGATGDVRRLRLGAEARDDSLTAIGTEEAARALAHTLDAELAPDGADFRISASGIVERMAYLKAPAGLREVRPQMVGEPPSSAAAIPGFGIVRTGPSTTSAALQATSDGSGPLRVGFYVTDGRYLRLDASGGFRLQSICGSIAVEGTYQPKDGSVVLTPTEGEPLVWRIDPRGLVDPEGSLLSVGEP